MSRRIRALEKALRVRLIELGADGRENTLTKWIGAVDAGLPALRSFTAGLRRDLDAVVAGPTLEYAPAPVEGIKQ